MRLTTSDVNQIAWRDPGKIADRAGTVETRPEQVR